MGLAHYRCYRLLGYYEPIDPSFRAFRTVAVQQVLNINTMLLYQF
jgi:hypothetical protein